MAKYFLHIKVFSRGKGSRVTRAAAYRAGERIRDERTSEVYNHSDRDDVLHKEVMLASQFAGRTDRVPDDGPRRVSVRAVWCSLVRNQVLKRFLTIDPKGRGKRTFNVSVPTPSMYTVPERSINSCMT